MWGLGLGFKDSFSVLTGSGCLPFRKQPLNPDTLDTESKLQNLNPETLNPNTTSTTTLLLTAKSLLKTQNRQPKMEPKTLNPKPLEPLQVEKGGRYRSCLGLPGGKALATLRTKRTLKGFRVHLPYRDS